MVHAVHVPRTPVVLIGGAAVLLLAAAVIAALLLQTRPAAVVMIERQGGTTVKLTYLTSGARSVDIVEHSAGGNQITISGVVSPDAQTLRRGPWQSSSALPVQYDIVAKAFGAQSVDSIKVGALVAASPVPQGGGTNDPVSVVRSYYTYWNAKRFGEMWNLLTPAFKSKTAYDTWVGEHNYDKSVTIRSANAAGNGKVAVVVVAVDQDPSGALKSHTYSLTWTVVQENGHWLLDSVQ